MLYSLFFLNDSGTVEEILTLDVVKSFDERYAGSIPSMPVESGFRVADTINLSNPSFSLTGIITDSKFRVNGEMVRYVNGAFVKTAGDSRDTLRGIKSDKPSLLVKERLITIYKEKQVFGIIESTDPNNIEGSRVRYIYPCGLSDLSFNKSDASDAVYPSLSIENIRVTQVTFKEVKNAVPELIPLVDSHLNAGNQNGVTGSTTTPKSDADDILKAQKKQADDLTKDISGTSADMKAAHAEIRKDQMKEGFTREAIDAYRVKLASGKAYGSSLEEFTNEYVKIKMNRLYGVGGW